MPERRTTILRPAVCKLFTHHHFTIAMGWRFRKTFGRGPFRWTLTKKGIGASWGIPGLRFGISPSGQKYYSVGIPRTGLYYIKYFPVKTVLMQLTTPQLNPKQPAFLKGTTPVVKQSPNAIAPNVNQQPWWKQKGL